MEQLQNIRRDRSEIVQKLQEQLSLLKEHCFHFDNGDFHYVYPISAVLRILLKETKNCHSILGQLGMLESLEFVDSAHHVKNGVCCWIIGDNVHDICAIDGKVYAGLCAKTLAMKDRDILVRLRPLFQHYNTPPVRKINFETWYNDIVFDDGERQMSRKSIIENIAEKEGGCHLDSNMTIEQATFREPKSLQIQINGQQVEFRPEPVYTSLRQIAWEVLETLKKTL